MKNVAFLFCFVILTTSSFIRTISYRVISHTNFYCSLRLDTVFALSSTKQSSNEILSSRVDPLKYFRTVLQGSIVFWYRFYKHSCGVDQGISKGVRVGIGNY